MKNIKIKNFQEAEDILKAAGSEFYLMSNFINLLKMK